jgi:hypothetical protein
MCASACVFVISPDYKYIITQVGADVNKNFQLSLGKNTGVVFETINCFVGAGGKSLEILQRISGENNRRPSRPTKQKDKPQKQLESSFDEQRSFAPEFLLSNSGAKQNNCASRFFVDYLHVNKTTCCFKYH